MTPEQIYWASLHDWFTKDNGDGSVTCMERWGDGSEKAVVFRDYQKLRAWAGY